MENLHNLLQLVQGNWVPFVVGFAVGHIPWLIKLVVTAPPIKAWIKANPKLAEEIVTALKQDVDEIVAEPPTPPAA